MPASGCAQNAAASVFSTLQANAANTGVADNPVLGREACHNTKYALGNLVRFLLLSRQAHDMQGVAPLIKDLSFTVLLAGKAFDADWLMQDFSQRGATAE